jgi:RNA polymerase sigma-70 factor (ECF subfamily)
MGSKLATSVQKQVETLWREGTAAGLTDGQLLERFVNRRQATPESAEAAFAVLVDRHGAMVLRACRRILREEHDAEDAAQATFLVLARRAPLGAGYRSVGGWLHEVAIRVASKARVAATRRRVRENRYGESCTRLKQEPQTDVNDAERWSELHEELGRLPQSFQAPLVLCYLEGMTQEQAAARLGWPLGTVQSRLARGRAKLKVRLIRRGAAPAVGLISAGLATAASPAAAVWGPWFDATVRLAIAFTQQTGWAVKAGAGPASAGLALEVLREMGYAKLTIALVSTLVIAAALTGVAAVSTKLPSGSSPTIVEQPQAKPTPDTKTAPPPAPADTTVRGLVRDNKGRPLAKVWVGSDPRPLADTWDTPRPEEIREVRAAFRDRAGRVIPPGAVGKYFEVRDSRGQWKPVSPDDIRPFDAVVWSGDGQALSKEEVAKDHSPYTIRKSKGGWWMAGMPGVQDPARTDAQGQFRTTFPDNSARITKLHFASADFTLQAIRVIKPEDVDKPIDVTLSPTRLVQARVIEVPKDDPKAYMDWSIYTVDAAGKPVAEWQRWILPNPNANDPDHMKRHLDVRLPVGRYKIEFSSQTLRRLVDLDVPPGDGPLELPDLVLESLASVRMVGQPAAEIDAVDLDGTLAKLVDFRGKVIVLDFWATWCGPCVGAMPRLIELQKRFRDRPVVFLALHDGSLGSAEEYRKSAEPLKRHWGGGDLPLRVLLDQPPVATTKQANLPGPGEKGSGRTANTYEVRSWPSTFVIAPDGRLVGQYDLDALEGALEDQFGLPRSRPVQTIAAGRAEPPKEFRNVTVKGKVVGPDGKPVVGATLQPRTVVVRQKGIKTGADGGFEFVAERILIDHFALSVEAPGLASKVFTLSATGVVPEPLKLGVGAVVTGRVLRDGKPVAGASMGLRQSSRGMDEYLGELRAKTDDQGRFHFDHAFADQEFSAYAVTGSLANHGVITPRVFRTAGDGTAIDLGEFEVKRSRRLAGRVVFSDGKAVPQRTQVLASCELASGLLRAKVGAQGRFEILGLPESEVSVSVQFPQITTWLPPGYRLSSRNKCADPLNTFQLVGKLDRDVDDLVILFEPGEEPHADYSPGALEDFKEARSGTIAGAPPEAAREK